MRPAPVCGGGSAVAVEEAERPGRVRAGQGAGVVSGLGPARWRDSRAPRVMRPAPVCGGGSAAAAEEAERPGRVRAGQGAGVVSGLRLARARVACAAGYAARAGAAAGARLRRRKPSAPVESGQVKARVWYPV